MDRVATDQVQRAAPAAKIAPCTTTVGPPEAPERGDSL
jgi:hypothetical protein